MSIQAVRALRKLREVNSEKFQAMEEFHECDRHFDAGEWSDRFHGEMMEEEEDRMIKIVADRFGFGVMELRNLERAADDEEWVRMMDTTGQSISQR